MTSGATVEPVERSATKGTKDGQSSVDPAKSVAAVWIPILLSLAVAAANGLGWYLEHKHQVAEQQQAVALENERLVNGYLIKMRVALEGARVISAELKQSYLEPGWGILESYAIKVGRDGPVTHELMYKRIVRLVNYNSAILALLDGYEPYVMTDAFSKQAAEFRDHAERYIDRWEVLPSFIATNQQLPVAKVFPPEFPAALEAEITARMAR